MSALWNVTASSASTGPVNNQIIPNAYLRKITTMAVCLTSTVTQHPLLLFFPLTSSPVIKVGKLNTPNVLCFHLVVTVT